MILGPLAPFQIKLVDEKYALVFRCRKGCIVSPLLHADFCPFSIFFLIDVLYDTKFMRRWSRSVHKHKYHKSKLRAQWTIFFMSTTFLSIRMWHNCVSIKARPTFRYLVPRLIAGSLWERDKHKGLPEGWFCLMNAKASPDCDRKSLTYSWCKCILYMAA